MKLGGNRPPGDNLFDKWHGIFYMPSRIDEAGHTKAFDYSVAEHWGGGGEMFSSAGGTRTDNTSVASRTRTRYNLPGTQVNLSLLITRAGGTPGFHGYRKTHGCGLSDQYSWCCKVVVMNI